MNRMLRFLLPFGLLLALLFVLPCGKAASASSGLPYRFHTEWAKLSAVDGRTLTPPLEKNTSMAVLWLMPQSGYHSYAHEGGDEGIPLTVTVLADGEPLGPGKVQIHYVPGTETSLPSGGRSYLYHGVIPVFLVFREVESRAVTLDISLLACSDQHCRPVHTRILLPTAPAELPNAAQQSWFQQFLESPACCGEENIPPEIPSVPETFAEPAPQKHADLLPDAPTSVFQKRSKLNAAPAVPLPSAVSRAEPEGWDLAPQHLEGSFQIDGWPRAVGLGLLAGLLLNFMPCVLPVLTMKFSLLLDNEESFEARRKTIREHTMFFAAGIVAWFTLLAIISGLTGILWGQLFQSSEVIFLMLLIVFCMGLSMFDVFHLPVLDLQTHHSSSPRMQAFSTGMFTTLLATPCSGPLLGGVLAWGITKPLPVLMTIFAATGVGMAAPYVALACYPRLVRFLPKPGAWLSVLERVLGLMLMGTAIYLFSLLPPALHVKTLITLLVAATTAWIWGRWGSLRGSITRRMFLGAFAVGAIFLSGFWAFLPAQKEIVPWVEFSEETFREDFGKKAMIVEFTADWCPTCKVLERTTLAAPNLLPILDQYSLTAVKVDMTFKNDAHQKLLRALNSASIPLLAVFPAGEGAASPVILRDIYTTTDLHLALRQAKIPHKRMVEMLNPVKLLSQPRE
ncbi:protein-disulfide reductase DsbD family protein [Mailhella massiliensis]|uniref:protein-disulfide reductase DsbD family protein n=2 Tax=Mailhella massiliensis TaxID=1903261 RepID=UPI00118574F9|nr:cytochrome c biogenesis protein CcdA [Mailhella massiliensis]